MYYPEKYIQTPTNTLIHKQVPKIEYISISKEFTKNFTFTQS